MEQKKLICLISEKRESIGLSQRQLAIQVGVAASTISYVECGALSKFPTAKVRNLAKALQIEPEDFTKMWIDAALSSYRQKLEQKIASGE